MLLAATIPQLQSNLRQDPKPLNGEKIEISSPFALWTLFSLWWFRISWKHAHPERSEGSPAKPQNVVIPSGRWHLGSRL